MVSSVKKKLHINTIYERRSLSLFEFYYYKRNTSFVFIFRISDSMKEYSLSYLLSRLICPSRQAEQIEGNSSLIPLYQLLLLIDLVLHRN